MIELTQAMAAWPTVVDRQQVVALWRQYRRQQDPNGLLINVDVTSDHDTLTESVLISVGNTHSLAQEVITDLMNDENSICVIGPRFERFKRSIVRIANDTQLRDDVHTIISSLVDRWASALATNHASKSASVDFRERQMGVARAAISHRESLRWASLCGAAPAQPTPPPPRRAPRRQHECPLSSWGVDALTPLPATYQDAVGRIVVAVNACVPFLVCPVSGRQAAANVVLSELENRSYIEFCNRLGGRAEPFVMVDSTTFLPFPPGDPVGAVVFYISGWVVQGDAGCPSAADARFCRQCMQLLCRGMRQLSWKDPRHDGSMCGGWLHSTTVCRPRHGTVRRQGVRNVCDTKHADVCLDLRT